jgi:hypothetical protein
MSIGATVGRGFPTDVADVLLAAMGHAEHSIVDEMHAQEVVPVYFF